MLSHSPTDARDGSIGFQMGWMYVANIFYVAGFVAAHGAFGVAFDLVPSKLLRDSTGMRSISTRRAFYDPVDMQRRFRKGKFCNTTAASIFVSDAAWGFERVSPLPRFSRRLPALHMGSKKPIAAVAAGEVHRPLHRVRFRLWYGERLQAKNNISRKAIVYRLSVPYSRRRRGVTATRSSSYLSTMRR